MAQDRQTAANSTALARPQTRQRRTMVRLCVGWHSSHCPCPQLV